jgi:hypothetical protein
MKNFFMANAADADLRRLPDRSIKGGQWFRKDPVQRLAEDNSMTSRE